MEYLILAVGILFWGAIFTLCVKEPYKLKVMTILSVIASLTALYPAFLVLINGTELVTNLNFNVLFGTIPLKLSPLSAIFVIIISIMSSLVVIYSSGYLKPYVEKRKSISSHCFFLMLLIASMLSVVITKHGLFFLFVWEIMSLSSFFLVIFEGENKVVLKAGIKYLIYMHLSVLFLIAMFALLTNTTHSFLFSDYGNALANDPQLANIVFILGFIGFGIKAGFIPFHNWLPTAHPAAPSHVSALMSGVMIKTGLFGILEILLLIKKPAPELAYIVLIVSLMTAIYGILYAITQEDVKKILACSSIENIGIIGIGIAIAMFGIIANNHLVTTIAFAGSFLHIINHSLFKVMMFMTAGNVYHKTHTRNIENLGGLIKKMPFTAVIATIGAVAICGLPVLNSFISEVLIYASMLLDLQASNINLFVTKLLSLGCLAFVGSIAILCFSRFVGIAFLGEPRSSHSMNVKNDVSSIMLIPSFIISACIFFIGLFPQYVLGYVLCPASLYIQNDKTIDLFKSITTFAATISQVLLILLAIIFVIFVLRFIFKNHSRTHETWGCGYDKPSASIQYTASSYANPLITMIKHLFKRVSHVKKPKELFPKEAYYEQEIEDIEEAYIVTPLIKLDEKFLTKFERIQNGNIQQYILFGLIFLVLAIFGVIYIG